MTTRAVAERKKKNKENKALLTSAEDSTYLNDALSSLKAYLFLPCRETLASSLRRTILSQMTTSFLTCVREDNKIRVRIGRGGEKNDNESKTLRREERSFGKHL